MTRRTVLIGLDGATFSILDPLMEEGTMPFLRSFVASGVRANLNSVIPALTPPAWTSLVTGRSPGRHGILDFLRRESVENHGIRLLTSRDISCETVWELVNQHDLRATVLNFPLTFPPPAINGYVVPGGWMPWRQLKLGCHPPELFEKLKALPGFNQRKLAMDASHEEKALEGCRQDEYEEWIALHIEREQQWHNVLRYLMREDPVDLTAVLFDGVDKLQHLCWRLLDPVLVHTLQSASERRLGERLKGYFRQIDAIMAEIVELAGREATVVLASDHGFGAQKRRFFINSWLEKRGYLSWANGKAPRASDGKQLGMGQLARHVFLLDWRKTKAYAPTPSGNGIHIVRFDHEHPQGVKQEEYEPLRNRLIEELSALRDPTNDELVVARVWKREEIFDGPHLGVAPDLTLQLEDGGFVSILASQEPITHLEQPVGTHRPEGIFIARGPELRRNAELPSLSILDVAPFIVHSLGLSVPAEWEGRVPTEALEPAATRARPVETRREREPARAPSAPREVTMSEEDEEEIAKRLRALGYIE